MNAESSQNIQEDFEERDKEEEMQEVVVTDGKNKTFKCIQVRGRVLELVASVNVHLIPRSPFVSQLGDLTAVAVANVLTLPLRTRSRNRGR